MESALKTVKGQLKTEKLKSSAAEVGTTIIDGIGSMIGTSKVKRQEQEIARLHGVITEKEQENNALKKEVNAMQIMIKQVKDQAGKVAQGLRDEITHLHELMPELKELLRVEQICHAVRFSAELTKRILRGESVGFIGSLYSPEHKKSLRTDHSVAKMERDPQERGRLRLSVDGIDVFGWLKRKHEEQYPRPEIKQVPRINRGKGFGL